MYPKNIPSGYCQCGCGARTNIIPITSARRGLVKGEHYRFLVGHNARRGPVDYVAEDRGHKTPCWIWQRHIDQGGYGRVGHEGRLRNAHVVYWERENRPVPHGLELDHLCRVTACVNPAHLEPVTHAENMRRGVNTKLSAEQALAIRCAHDAGQRRQSIADAYGVSIHLVDAIGYRRVWRGLPE